MCALIQVHHLAVCDKHSGIFAFPLSFIALQFGCRGVVAGISPVLLLTCILSWHLYSGSDHITNWNTYARLSDVTLLNKLTPLATQQSVIGFVGITAKDFLRIAEDRRWSFLIIGKRQGIDPGRLVFSIKKSCQQFAGHFKKKKKPAKQDPGRRRVCACSFHSHHTLRSHHPPLKTRRSGGVRGTQLLGMPESAACSTLFTWE